MPVVRATADARVCVTFQHGNDPKHTARSVKAWLGQQPLKIMDWPAYSPDLNLIEHVWTEVKHKPNHYSTPPSGVIELYERVEDIMKHFDKGYILKLYKSMPIRMEAVIRQNDSGRNTNL